MGSCSRILISQEKPNLQYGREVDLKSNTLYPILKIKIGVVWKFKFYITSWYYHLIKFGTFIILTKIKRIFYQIFIHNCQNEEASKKWNPTSRKLIEKKIEATFSPFLAVILCCERPTKIQDKLGARL